MILLKYADLQNLFITLFTRETLRRREFGLSQLRTYSEVLQSLSLLNAVKDGRVQERVNSAISGWCINDYAAWLRPRLETLMGKLGNEGANAKLKALMDRL